MNCQQAPNGNMSPNGTVFAASLFATAPASICNRNPESRSRDIFPELGRGALNKLKVDKFVLDGEIVIPVDGNLSFDDLLHAHSSRRQPRSSN